MVGFALAGMTIIGCLVLFFAVMTRGASKQAFLLRTKTGRSKNNSIYQKMLFPFLPKSKYKISIIKEVSRPIGGY
jgi:hypothetical protein